MVPLYCIGNNGEKVDRRRPSGFPIKPFHSVLYIDVGLKLTNLIVDSETEDVAALGKMIENGGNGNIRKVALALQKTCTGAVMQSVC